MSGKNLDKAKTIMLYALCLGCVGLAGCGQIAPLYLPDGTALAHGNLDDDFVAKLTKVESKTGVCNG